MEIGQPADQTLASFPHEQETEEWTRLGEKIAERLRNEDIPASDLYSLKEEDSDLNLASHQKTWLEKGWEIASLSLPSALLFFKNTPLLLKQLKAYQLPFWGDWVIQLLRTGGKNEPTAIAFLALSPEAVQLMSMYELKRWLAAGYHLSRQSADMGTAYFSALPEEFSHLYMTERLAVYQVLTELAEDFPDQGLAFYRSSPQALYRVNSTVRTRILDIVKQIAHERPEKVVSFFNAFISLWEHLDYPSQECILEGEKKIRPLALDVSLDYLLKSGELLASVPRAFVRNFLDKGISVFNRNEHEGLLYFRLESNGSQREMKKWKQAILLEDHREVLNYFVQALSGREIHIRNQEEDPDIEGFQSGIRPAGEGFSLYLPAYSAGGGDLRENFIRYKVAAAHQAGYVEWGIFKDQSFLRQVDFEYFELKGLAEDIFFILEDGRIDHLLRKEYRGLAGEVIRVLEQELNERPSPSTLPLQEALVEILLRLVCGFGPERNLPGLWVRHVWFLEEQLAGFYESEPGLREVYRKMEKIYDYISRMPLGEAYRPLIPLMVHGHEETELLKNRLGPWPALPDRMTCEPEEEKPIFQKSTQEKSRIYEPDLIPNLRFMDDEEEIVGQGIFIKEAPQPLAKPRREKRKETEGNSQKGNLSFSSHQEIIGSGPFYYDEWDYQSGSYRSRWCRLYEKDIRPVDSEVVRGVYCNHQDLIEKVKRKFQRIRPEQLRTVRGVESGHEFHWPALIQSVVEHRAGVGATERIFTHREKRQRKVSILFLVDMSASTGEPVPCQDGQAGPEKKIIDIEVESLVVMMEALDAFSDEYAVYGFSGYGRDQVDFFRIKNFNDSYSESLRKRIGGIEPQKSTRMGPAIRHAVQKMRKVDSDQRLLILISDGFPQDSDYGEDRASREYGLQDTMMALVEAGREGIRPFCITVDQAGNDYLRRMCDPASYLVIQDIYGLPETLPKIVASLMLG